MKRQNWPFRLVGGGSDVHMLEAYGPSRLYAGEMPERPRRPDLDEQFSLPEETDPDEVLSRLLENDEGSEVSTDLDDDGEDG